MFFERNVFIENELQKSDKGNGDKFANQLIPTSLIHHQPKHERTQPKSCQTHGIKGKKTLGRLVLHPEIKGTVEQKRSENANVRADDIRPKVGHQIKMAEQGVDSKVECGTKTANNAIEDKVAETAVQFYDSLFHADSAFVGHCHHLPSG